VWTEELRKWKKSNDIIGNRTRDFPACSPVMFKVIGQESHALCEKHATEGS
jgi:hypothetical protein